MHGGAEAFGYVKQEYVWLGGSHLTNPSQLTKILDVWELERPNLIMNLVPSDIHPKWLIRKEMLSQPELADVLQKAKDSLKLEQEAFAIANHKQASVGPGADAEFAQILRMLGDSLYNRLVSVMVALVDALASTNSWLLLDNSCAALTSSYFLEAALQRTSSRPVILCVADSNAGLFRSKDRPELERAWDLLAENAVALPSEATSENLPVTRLPEEIFTGGFDSLWPRPSYEDSTDTQLAYKHPMNQWFFRGASHYMFVVGPGVHELYGSANGLATPFPFHWLGSVGHIFMNGESGSEFTTDHLIFRALTAGEPAIILKHTGRASDIWGQLIDIVKRDQQTSEDGVIRRMNERYPFWYADGTPESLYGGTNLNHNIYPFVAALLTVSAAQLQNSTVVIDSWRDNPEVVLKRLSHCMAASSEGAIELGAGDAEDNVISKVWRQQAVLEYNCVVFNSLANRMTLGGLLLSFLSTSIAVTSTYVKANNDVAWAERLEKNPRWNYVNVSLMVLPALAGLLVTLLSRLRYVSKWAAVYSAAQQTESEIYKYRVKALEYDLRATPVPSAKGKKTKVGNKSDKDEGMKLRGKGAIRSLFVTRTSAIFQAVMTSEISQDALAEPYSLEDSLRKKQEKTLKICADRRKAPRGIQGLQRTSRDYANLNSVDHSPELAVPVLQEEEELDADDLITALSSEEYFEHRVLPTLERYQKLAPQLSRRLTTYEVLIVIASLVSTLLGAFQWTEWIPIAVSLGAVFSSLLTYESLQSRVAAVNAAIQDLTSVQARWSSYGVVEKRTPSVKTSIVEMTEAAIMRETAAYTAGAGNVVTRMGKKEGGDGENEKEDGDEEKGEKKRS